MSVLNHPRSDSILRFSSVTPSLIGHRDRHYCPVPRPRAPRVLEAKCRTRRTQTRRVYLAILVLPLFSLSYFFLLFHSPFSIFFFSCSSSRRDDVSIFTGVEALRFLEWIPCSLLNLPYSSSRYARAFTPACECRCALGRISPEETRG